MNRFFIPKDRLMVERQITPQYITKIWKYYELGVVGMDNDRLPYIDMAKHFDINGLDAVRTEAEVSMRSDQFRNWKAWSSCMIPWEVNQQHQFAYYINHFDELCSPEDRKKIVNIETLVDWVLAQGYEPGWNRTAHLRHYFDRQNRQEYAYKNLECRWLNEIELFPVLKNWLETNVFPCFKTVGRVVLFQNDPNNRILIHRDLWAYTHNNHFINFFLNKEPRKFFIFDEATGTKHYVNTRAFMFNESDLHGSDIEGQDHYTLRIDGIFTDDFIQQAGLKNNGWMFTEQHPLIKQIPNLTYITT